MDPQPPPQGSQPSPSTKVERRIIEKNRRTQMKNLCSKLNSLLPNHNPEEGLPLPDQIDEAIKYIKSLETKVKTAKEKKESLILMGRKRSRSGCSSSSEANKGSLIKSPKIEIHEIGSSLEIILTHGVDHHDQFIFSEIVRILHEENVEVITANSSLAGDSVVHVVHAEIQQPFFQFGAAKVSERLRRFVNGSMSEVELEPNLWDFEIGTETWEELLHPTLVNKGLPKPL